MQQSKKWIFFIGFFIIVMVKLIIRPYVSLPPSLCLYRDVAPNLISAFLIPFVADLFLKKWIQLVNKQTVLYVSLIGLVILSLNEFVQLFPIFKRTFDYFDLLFSFIGVGVGYLVFTRYFMPMHTKKASMY